MAPKRSIFYAVTLLLLVLILIFTSKNCSMQNQNPSKFLNGEIKVYNSSKKKIMYMYLEEYVKGVVAAEMPADYQLEALKAQAIAARTYAYGRAKRIYLPSGEVHLDCDICTDPSHCQAWISFEEFKGNRNKIEQAVNETKGQLITYNGEVINPLFHSNSGGRTENVEDVWGGGGVPYLKSVFSIGEDGIPEYKSNVIITFKNFVGIIKKNYPSVKISEKTLAKNIGITEMTDGGRVKKIRVGNVVINGTDFRKMFSLRSTNFTIKQNSKDSFCIETLGYGHGVGMSQCGANYLAELGESYADILKYYYTGVEIVGAGSKPALK